jgi:hypothetical protein
MIRFAVFTVFPTSGFMSILTYGNIALIVLFNFRGYNKNEIFAGHWDK